MRVCMRPSDTRIIRPNTFYNIGFKEKKSLVFKAQCYRFFQDVVPLRTSAIADVAWSMHPHTIPIRALKTHCFACKTLS